MWKGIPPILSHPDALRGSDIITGPPSSTELSLLLAHFSTSCASPLPTNIVTLLTWVVPPLPGVDTHFSWPILIAFMRCWSLIWVKPESGHEVIQMRKGWQQLWGKDYIKGVHKNSKYIRLIGPSFSLLEKSYKYGRGKKLE